MIFDLYFAGSSYEEVMKYGKEKNICKLFTQAGERKSITEWANEKIEGKIKNKLFVDSGAYTSHTKGHDVDVDDYINYVNNLDEGITLFAQVDKIPGKFGIPRTREEILKAPAESWDNYLYMRNKVKSPEKLVPIFHQDEQFRWLENMLEWKDENGHHIPYIGISSSKDKAPKFREAWYWKVFDVIERSSNPGVKTHSFGTSSIRHLETFPFTSSDATSWLRGAAFGSITTDYGTILVSGVQDKDKAHINACPISYDNLKEYVLNYGFELNELIYDTEDSKAHIKRQMFNIAYLQKWAENYQYKGPKSFIRKGLF